MRFLPRAAVAVAVLVLAPAAHAGPLLPAELELQPELALPSLQLSPLALDAAKKKKKAAPAAQPAPSPAPAAAPPDLGASSPAPESPAAEPAPPAAKPAAPAPDVPASDATPPAAAPSGGPDQGGDLGFDLLGEAKPKVKSESELRVERQTSTRRTMLTFHQGVGLTTLGLLAGTVVVGQLNYMDRFSSPVTTSSGRWEKTHTVLATGTLIGFGATGMLALFAPVPYDKPVRADTTLVHKLCMGGATLGMASEMGLGLYTASREGYGNQRSIAQAHQIIGFTTLVLMSAGASAFLF